MIRVKEYTANEALAYLQQAITNGPARKLDGASALATELGYFPLALAQAAAFIQDRQETCAGYGELLRDSPLSKALPAIAIADDYQSTVTATLWISVERADRLPPEGLARATLQFASGLDPNGAPIDLFTTDAARRYIGAHLATAKGRNTGPNKQDCLYSLTNLDRFNLAIFDSSAGMVCTHALVQRATLEELSPEALLITVTAVNDALMELWTNVEGDINDEQMLWNSLNSLRNRYGHLL